MGFHTFDPSQIDRLEDPSRFRHCSREELIQWLPTGPDVRLLDVGSGSGFYTDELATVVGEAIALDVQPAMHRHYRERGVPRNVSLVTASADHLPIRDSTVDAALSTMSFHETTTAAANAELHRVLAAEGTAVIVDWSAEGSGAAGPPVAERYDVARAAELLREAGFAIRLAAERDETFLLVADHSSDNNS